MNFDETKIAFDDLLAHMEPVYVNSFLQWLKSNLSHKRESCRRNVDVIMDSIRAELKKRLPRDAISSTEEIIFPTKGENTDYDPSNTIHVDAFLYDDDSVDDLCDKGLLSRNYCAKCGSHNVQPLTFITHSASSNQLRYIFQHVLPNIEGKTVLDVGSRTGAVLYGAYLYSRAKEIHGVEMDESFYKLQQQIIQKFDLADRITIIHADILQHADLVQTADVVILNNVFQFFLSPESQIVLWKFLYDNLRKSGSMVITVPSIEKSIDQLKMSDSIDLCEWLKPIDISDRLMAGNLALFGSPNSDESDLYPFHLYKVI